MSPLWQVAVLVVAAVSIVQAILFVALARQVGTLLATIRPSDPREVGGGPDLSSFDPRPEFPPGRARLVLFMAPRCPPCDELRPHLPTLRSAYPALDLIAVVGLADEAARNEYADNLGPIARTDLTVLFEEWRVPGTPFAVALDEAAQPRRAGVVNNLSQLETMAEAALLPVQTHVAPASSLTLESVPAQSSVN